MSVAVKSNSVLMIGAHDSGKSNFLMRLWLALDAAQGILVKDGNPRELDYLRNGAAALLTGKYAGHTSSDVYERVEISVKNNPTAKVQYSGTLFVPDLAGEQIPAIYRNRQWSQAWEDQIQVGCSCLLFVRIESKELVAPLDWVQCSALLGGIIPEVAGDAPGAVDVGGIAEPGENSGTNAIAPEHKNLDDPQEDESEPEKPPTQVVLVDWLQFLRAAFTARAGGDYKPRIGIVVSAWDKAPADQQNLGAAKWVSSNLPMLADFCDANDEALDFQFFGVTVTDGDLEENATFKAEYLQGNPRKAGRISQGKAEHDRAETQTAIAKEWLASDSAKEWAKLRPSMAGVDLRPYLFVAKDRKDYFGAVTQFGQVAAIAEKLLGAKIAVQRDGESLRSLAAPEASQIFDALRGLIVATDDFKSKPKGIDGMDVLVRAQPHLQTNLLDFLGSLPPERLGTWACVGWDSALKDPAALDRYKEIQQEWVNTGSKELKAFVVARLQLPTERGR